MADERSLLEEFRPFLRYDSNEGYFADSAAEMTDAESGRSLTPGRTRALTSDEGIEMAGALERFRARRREAAVEARGAP